MNLEEDPILNRAMNSAMALLARREHSQKELSQKLGRHYCGETVETVLASLIDSGLQSDERYSESLVRSRISRGQGPLKIRYEAMQKGVSDQIIDEKLAPHEGLWLDYATDILRRRYPVSQDSQEQVLTTKEQAKRYRLLMSRGFAPEVCKKAVAAALVEL